MGLSDRGVLAPGMRADLAVFDAGGFADTTTTFEPNRLATGMRHVVVNGTLTLKDDTSLPICALTGERGGAVLRKE